MTDAYGHVPVMVEEVLRLLDPAAGETVLDGTVGRGGHAAAIIPRLGPGGRYIGLDLDAENVAAAGDRLRPIAAEAGVELTLHHASFADARALLEKLGVPAVDGLLADLGFASTQMEDPGRGLSFAEEGPLDMRLDRDQPVTAAELVSRLPERELADLIYQLGQEPMSRRIARKIVDERRRSPIETTRQLAELVRQAYGPRARQSRMHPATRTFMALRIAVNGELEALEQLLADLPNLLATGGRAVVISFHSLEDRRVKQAFQQQERRGWAERLTRKPMTPAEEEIAANPRSRSAKLRALRRVSG